MLTALRVQLDTLHLQVAPLRLSASYSFDQVPVIDTLANPRVLAFLCVLGLALALSWRWRRARPHYDAPHALLVLALLRKGRRPEAVNAYQRLARGSPESDELPRLREVLFSGQPHRPGG